MENGDGMLMLSGMDGGGESLRVDDDDDDDDDDFALFFLLLFHDAIVQGPIVF